MKIILGVLLATTVVLCILVTPLGGFETRAAGDTMPLGFAAVGVFFIGVALDATAVAMLLLRKPRGLTLALVGPLLFFPVVIVERLGFFSAIPPPPAIAAIELAGAVTAALAFATAFAARRAV